LPPRCFRAEEGNISRLFPNSRAAEIEYFRASRHFPIMHLIAIRRALAGDPELVSAVFSAFAAAKEYALAELGVTQAPKVTLPWIAAAAEETKVVLGEDYWPSGIGCNRAVLSEFLSDAQEARLTEGRLAVEDLFHPALLTT
jgi:4,5-dihydroxyphthalate decarboxylase